jgi:hypothetical protein
VVINVIPDPHPGQNSPPFATDDFDTTLVDTPVIINVLPNDSDPNGDSLVNSTIITQPLHGTVLASGPNGTFTYIPSTGYSGPDSFVYLVCDNGTPPQCSEATVYILVKPVNPPVAADDTNTMIEDGTPINVADGSPLDLLSNDTDPENDPLTNLYN